MTPLRRNLRRLRTIVVTAFSLVCITLALAIGLAGVLLPLVERYPQQVSNWLSKRLDMQVSLGTVSGRWSARGPVLGFSDLTLADQGSPVLQLAQGELAVDIYAWLLPQRHPLEFRLSGLQLEVERREEGDWTLVGLGGSAGPSPDAAQRRWLSRIGALRLSDSTVLISDRAEGRLLELLATDLLLRSSGQRLAVEGELHHRSSPDAGSLTLMAELQIVDDAGLRLQIERAWARAAGLDLGVWLAALPRGPSWQAGSVDLELWLRSDAELGLDMQMQLAARDLVLQRRQPLNLREDLSIAPRIAFSELSAFIEMQGHNRQGWYLRLSELAYTRLGRRNGGLWLEAQSDSDGALALLLESADVNDLGSLVVVAGSGADSAMGWLHEASPSGRLQRFSVQHHPRDGLRFNGVLQQLATQPVGDVPGFSALDAAFSGDRDGLLATLSSSDLVVDTAGVFDDQIALNALDARLTAHRDSGDWALNIDDLDARGEGFSLEAAGSLSASRETPGLHIDMHARVLQGSVPVAKPFLQSRYTPPKTASWLNDNLLAGDLTQARAAFVGNGRDWPFGESGRGRFVAEGSVRGGALNLHDRWGSGTDIAAELSFVNSGLLVEARGGKLDGVGVDWARAEISSYRDPVLDLDLRTSADAAAVLGWLRSTPVYSRISGFVFGLALDGTVDIETQLQIPLKKALGSTSVQGQARFVELDVRDAKWGLNMNRTRGELRFSEDHLEARELNGFIDGEPVEVDLVFGSAVAEGGRIAEIALRGPLSAEDLLSIRPELAFLQGRIPGVAHWDLRFNLEAGEALSSSPWSLSLQSDLLGIGIDLPAPLSKGPAEARRLSLQLSQSPQHLDLSLGLAETIALAASWRSDQAPDLVLALGQGRVAPHGEPGLRVTGRTPELDMRAWLDGLDAIRGGTPDDDWPLVLDLRVDDLRWGGNSLGAVQFSSRDETARRSVLIDGERIAGTVSQPLAAAGSAQWQIVMDRLYWPRVEPDIDGSPIPAAPLPRSADATRVQPADLPPLRLRIDDLRVGALSLGSVDGETFPVQQGLQLERLELRSALLDADLRGTWLQSGSGSQSRLGVNLSSADVGSLLTGLGYASGLEGGQAVIQLDVGWPGGPAEFALKQVSGDLDLNVRDGHIRDVRPGAGRILGLFSLTEIPRRLSLDFGDLFQQGLAFNSIRGRFYLEGGAAFTDSLLVLSPAAEVQISGRTGLSDRNYDQEMLVLPAVGGSLPLVGALAAGPAGAAAGLVMQGVFNDPLRRAAATRYRIRGTWEAPEVELVERPRDAP